MLLQKRENKSSNVPVPALILNIRVILCLSVLRWRVRAWWPCQPLTVGWSAMSPLCWPRSSSYSSPFRCSSSYSARWVTHGKKCFVLQLFIILLLFLVLQLLWVLQKPPPTSNPPFFHPLSLFSNLHCLFTVVETNPPLKKWAFNSSEMAFTCIRSQRLESIFIYLVFLFFFFLLMHLSARLNWTEKNLLP